MLSVLGRPKSGQRSQAAWMQTTGRLLLGVQRCSSIRLRMAAHDGWSARGLLYLADVPIGGRDKEHHQGQSDDRLGSDQGKAQEGIRF